MDTRKYEIYFECWPGYHTISTVNYIKKIGALYFGALIAPLLSQLYLSAQLNQPISSMSRIQPANQLSEKISTNGKIWHFLMDFFKICIK